MNNELSHYGILGMKWGVRRYQNKDGSLTKAGQDRYNREQSNRKKAHTMIEKYVVPQSKSHEEAVNNWNETINQSRKEVRQSLNKQMAKTAAKGVFGTVAAGASGGVAMAMGLPITAATAFLGTASIGAKAVADCTAISKGKKLNDEFFDDCKKYGEEYFKKNYLTYINL